MPGAPQRYRPSGAPSQGEQRRQYDRARQGSETRQLYGWRWRNYAKAYRKRHPLCVMCEAEGEVTPSEIVDHIKPHRGDYQLFWDASNHQALCASHHNSVKQAQERAG